MEHERQESKPRASSTRVKPSTPSVLTLESLARKVKEIDYRLSLIERVWRGLQHVEIEVEPSSAD